MPLESIASIRTVSADATSLLQEEIQRHNQLKKNESYIGRAVDILYRKDDRTKEALERASSGSSEGTAVDKLIEDSQSSLRTQGNLNRWAGMIARTAPLFVPGLSGYASAVVLTGLDEAKPSDSAGLQAIDFCLGGMQGGLLKGALSWSTQGFGADFGTKGSLLATSMVAGGANRLITSALSRSSYYDEKIGSYSPLQGVWTIGQRTFNPASVRADFVLGAFSVAAGFAFDKLPRNLMNNSPIVNAMATGAVYGFVGGASNRISQAWGTEDGVSLGTVIASGLEGAAISAIAAVPGGLMAQAQLNHVRDENTRGLLRRESALHEMDHPSAQRHVRVINDEGMPIKELDVAGAKVPSKPEAYIEDYIGRRRTGPPLSESPGDAVKLDTANFGMDKKGIYVMSPQDADRNFFTPRNITIAGKDVWADNKLHTTNLPTYRNRHYDTGEVQVTTQNDGFYTSVRHVPAN